MLRNGVLALGASLIAFGLMGLMAGAYGPAIICMVWGAILVFGIIYERVAYKTIVDKAPVGAGWARTTERFVDEKSGRTITVYVKSLSGERAYVAEPIEGQGNPTSS
jgi:hypothetical protein